MRCLSVLTVQRIFETLIVEERKSNIREHVFCVLHSLTAYFLSTTVTEDTYLLEHLHLCSDTSVQEAKAMKENEMILICLLEYSNLLYLL